MSRMLGAALAAALIAGGATRAAAQDLGATAFRATTLSLSGDAEVRMRPNRAVVDLGVEVQAATAAQALARNRDRMSAVVSALHGLGVAETDIQTSTLQLDPQYASDEGRAAPRLTGYTASNAVTVRLHDMAKVGAAVDALVAAGANRIQGISFDLDDPAPAQDAARRAAVKALQAKAELYAQAAGYRLQRLVRLTETGSGGPPMAPMARVMVSAARRVSPVEPGEVSVHAEVQGEYELTR